MNIYARSALSAFLLLSTLTGVPATESAEYYIYRHPDGRLVLSNQKPPPGSKIIKQQRFPDTAEGETTLVQDGNEMRPNENATPSIDDCFVMVAYALIRSRQSCCGVQESHWRSGYWTQAKGVVGTNMSKYRRKMEAEHLYQWLICFFKTSSKSNWEQNKLVDAIRDQYIKLMEKVGELPPKKQPS